MPRATRLLFPLAFALALAGCATTPATQRQAVQTRDVFLFTSVLIENQTVLGVPPDAYYPPTIIVNKGDTVSVHFYNTEEASEQHSFTMEAPYAMDHVVDAGHSANFTFTANDVGVFQYACKFHPPSMIGSLVVLG